MASMLRTKNWDGDLGHTYLNIFSRFYMVLCSSQTLTTCAIISLVFCDGDNR